MKNEYFNNLGSERSVEIIFIENAIKKYYTTGNIVFQQ